jgi:phosphopantetheinyl transferase
MTVSERRGIASMLTSMEKAERLTKIWCVKEAYVKAIGEGVGYGLQRIDVSFGDEGRLEGVKFDGKQLEDDGWTVALGILEDEYIWVCVTESSDRSDVTLKIIPYQNVIHLMQS